MMSQPVLKCEICDQEIEPSPNYDALAQHRATEHKVHLFGYGESPEPFYAPLKSLDELKPKKKEPGSEPQEEKKAKKSSK